MRILLLPVKKNQKHLFWAIETLFQADATLSDDTVAYETYMADLKCILLARFSANMRTGKEKSIWYYKFCAEE